MKKTIIYGSFVWFILFAAGPMMAKANDGRPVCHWKLNNRTVLPFVTDTLPAQPNGTGKINNKPAADSIREVPKARNQVVPIPITQQIKPVKIIKPIIRPVIKILH